MYKQLIQPNTSAVDGVGWCLRHVQKVYGVNPQYPTARAAWDGQRGKHTSAPPTDASVPVWYSWHLGGVDYGHVAAKLADGRVLSSPFYASQGGQVIYPNMSAMLEALKTQGGNPHYLGWSEWLHDKQIVRFDGSNTPNTPNTPITTVKDDDGMRLWIADISGGWYLIVPAGGGKPNAVSLPGDSGMGGGGAARADIPVVRLRSLADLRKVANV